MSSQNEQILKAKNSELEKELGNKLLELQQKNRDLEIEGSLERVRIIAINMKHPDDLLGICEVLYNELVRLGFTELRNTVINIIDDSTGSFLNNDFSQFAGANVTTVSYNSHPATEYLVKQIKSANDAFTELVIKGSELEEWRNYLKGLGKKEDPRLQNIPELLYYFYSIGVGEIGISTYSSITEEKRNLLKRFRNVFDFSYRRYTDIARAEAQTREAKIEAALERVRARSMAMRNSNELADASSVLFHELKTLGIETIRTGVNIMDKEAETSELWMTSESNDEEHFEKRGLGVVSMHIHANALLFFNAWKNGEQYYSFELNGDEVMRHYDALSIPKQDIYNQKECVTGFFFPEGSLNLVTHKPLTNDVCNLMKRFALVFGLIYRRFLDLKEAEARAIDAVKRASLDRVRAEIASMRTTSDLEKITPLIWNELKALSVPFIRCGVFIMNNQQQQVHTFLSTPEGKAIAAFRLPYSAHKEMAQITAHWHKKERYIQHWDEAAFNDWSKTLVERGFITTGEKYLTENRPTNLHLHFLPFMQGMLYVGSDTPLNKDELQLVQNLADAFSIAYARYEDFNQLESAKMQIEKTLVDLKQAQAQLIQSEKMASLGELTAGIAHEIQNPLNFVNNFSEVNKELIDEMQQEIDKGNLEDAKAISISIKDNQEKINQHGKRADAIVKGMLQHSQTGKGQIEPTDINKLADEYLHLSYHGFRAKDKTFTAAMQTHFDETMVKINIIPQDIGRVLLNLYNNALYAVTEKKKIAGDNYEPIVSVSTKKINDKIEIRVKDNANGIPQKMLDKIFQPFFTTKPAGQGTGLGLSLSYDIVKAHGGEIIVETKVDEGSEFIIKIPTK